jgi:hypothetical protein
MASICCSPPESVPPFWARRSRRPREELEDLLEVGCDLVLVVAQERTHLEVLAHGHVREDPPALGHLDDPFAVT